MKNNNKGFVRQYKDILTLKNTHSFTANKKDIIKNVSLLSIIIITIFTLTGLLLNTLENLNYVFYALSMVVIGSFVIYRLTEEMKFKNKYSLEYNSSIAILNDSINLSAIIISSNSILFLFFFRSVISTGELIFVGIISLILLFVSSVIENSISYYFAKGPGSLFFSTLWVTAMYISLFYLLGIESITLAYLVSSAIICLLFLYKYFISKFKIINHREVNGIALFLVFISLGIIILDRDFLSNEIDDTIPLVGTVMNIDETLEFEEDNQVFYIINNSEYYYVKTMLGLHIYDYDLKLVNFIDNDLGYYKFYIDNDVLYFYKTFYASDFEDIGYSSKFKIVYSFDENWNVIEHLKTSYDSAPIYFPYLDNFAYVTSNFGLGVNEINHFIYLPGDFQYEYIYTNTSIPSEVIYERENFVVYQKSNQLFYEENETFHNGRKAILSYEQMTIIKLDTFIANDFSNQVSFDVGDVELDLFYTYNNLYYLLLDDTELETEALRIYNNEGKMVEEYIGDINIINISDSNIFLVDNEFKNIIKVLDYDDPFSYMIVGESIFLSNIAFIALLGALVIVDFDIRSLKRGVNHD